MNKIHIGTSGYSYPYWKNRFYPPGLPASRWLSYYSTHFDTVELNHTFYRFPTVAALQKAAAATPDHFSFSVKANRLLTHTKRMKDIRSEAEDFSHIVQSGLGAKLACILYQLPPSFSYTAERLEDVLMLRPWPGVITVIEFRHISWWQPSIYEALASAGLCFCNVSYPGLPGEMISTGKHYYKRMHGIPKLFQSAYDDKELAVLAGEVNTAETAFVYFNNTYYDAGYTNAAALQKLTGYETETKL